LDFVAGNSNKLQKTGFGRGNQLSMFTLGQDNWISKIG
jgi:hypothetical protein